MGTDVGVFLYALVLACAIAFDSMGNSEGLSWARARRILLMVFWPFVLLALVLSVVYGLVGQWLFE